MENVKSFAVMLVFAAAAGFIYWFLLPSGKVSKTAKSVLSVVFLLLALTPLFTFVGQEPPSFSVAPGEDLTADAALFAAATEEALKREIGAIVKAHTPMPFVLKLDAHISADWSVCIEQVTLCFSAAPSEPDALRAALSAALGTEPVFEIPEDE